jgi:hypothetical protein
MTRERFDEIVARLQEVGDISVYESSDGVMRITFEDFDGFDDDFDEVDREIVEPVLWEELEDFLDEVLDWDLYGDGTVFDELQLHVGYSSYDI